MDLRGCRVLALLNGVDLYGQEKGNLQAMKAIRELGASVVFGLTNYRDGGDVRNRVEQEGFSTVTIPFGCQWSKTFFKAKPSLLFTNSLSVIHCSRIARQIAKSQDLTHVHLGNPLVYSFIAPFLAINRQIKLVYRMGDAPPVGSRPNLAIWRSCLRRANAIVANSQFVRESALRLEPDHVAPIHLIYNLPMIASEASGKPKSFVATTKDRVPPVGSEEKGHVRLLFVGQLSQHKGIEDLINATLRLTEYYPDLKLDVLGDAAYDPEYKNWLQKLVSDANRSEQIRFHGYQPDPTPFYRAADLLVVPSRFDEPAANVSLEAKVLGIPSVVYPSGGLPELIGHRKNGFVCRERSVHALVEGIRWYLDCPQRLSAHRQAAICDFERRFGCERFVNEWRDVYRDSSNMETSIASV